MSVRIWHVGPSQQLPASLLEPLLAAVTPPEQLRLSAPGLGPLWPAKLAPESIKSACAVPVPLLSPEVTESERPAIRWPPALPPADWWPTAASSNRPSAPLARLIGSASSSLESPRFCSIRNRLALPNTTFLLQYLLWHTTFLLKFYSSLFCTLMPE
jgi:hypothetical protein